MNRLLSSEPARSVYSRRRMMNHAGGAVQPRFGQASQQLAATESGWDSSLLVRTSSSGRSANDFKRYIALNIAKAWCEYNP